MISNTHRSALIDYCLYTEICSFLSPHNIQKGRCHNDSCHTGSLCTQSSHVIIGLRAQFSSFIRAPSDGNGGIFLSCYKQQLESFVTSIPRIDFHHGTNQFPNDDFG